jgi:hypothetical protein
VTEETPDPLAAEGEHVSPAIDQAAFHCPWCGVLAAQRWTSLQYSDHGASEYGDAKFATCTNCGRRTYWLNMSEQERLAQYRMVKPLGVAGPRPHIEMPQDVKADYEEARSILALSPRGACALLRLATQKLVNDLEPGRGNLDEKIGRFVQKGLPVETQQALDVLRVTGNNAVHPGEMDLRDDTETATGLLNVLNFIVQDRIAQPKAIQRMFGALPEAAREAIERRDSD